MESSGTQQEFSGDFKADVYARRGPIRDMAYSVKRLMEHPAFRSEQTRPDAHGEMKANVMLAYRHLEDARMRLGKAVQAFDGGVSVYDK